MKKIIFFIGLIFVITGFASAQVRAGGTLYVAIKTVSLKSGTGLFTSTTGTLNYGDKVTVIRVSGSNVEVKSEANPSVTGWTASANLTAKQVVAGTSGSVSASETAMAGKGFTQEVETSYKNQNRNLNYADVDRVENIRVSEADLKRFLEEGRLRMGE